MYGCLLITEEDIYELFFRDLRIDEVRRVADNVFKDHEDHDFMVVDKEIDVYYV